MDDGKKRGLFILINFLGGSGYGINAVEEIINEWNKMAMEDNTWTSNLNNRINNIDLNTNNTKENTNLNGPLDVSITTRMPNKIIGIGGKTLTDLNGQLTGLRSDITLINPESAEDAIRAGFGGLYTDNSILHFMAESQLSLLSDLRDLLGKIAANTYILGAYEANNWGAVSNSLGYAGYKLNYTPKYAKGTNFVPEDGLAFPHEGEMVIPEDYSEQLRAMKVPTKPVQNYSEIIAELRDLKKEVKTLGKINRSGFNDSIKQQKRSADAQIELADKERLK